MSFSNGAHPAPYLGMADQPPTKRMRTNNARNEAAAAAATAAQPRACSASSSPFPFSFPFQPSDNIQTTNDEDAHPSFIISPDRDCKFGTNNLNSPAPAAHAHAAAALLFGATPVPAAESAPESVAVMQISQDCASDVDEPPLSMHESEQTPREWWKQRPAACSTGTGTASAAPPPLSASSSFSSLAHRGAAAAAALTCHVCNVNEAPPVQTSDGEVDVDAGTGARHPSHLNGSPYVANGPHHSSPAFNNVAGHPAHNHDHHYGNFQNQGMMLTPASHAAINSAPTRQKNSLLSYFQVRKAPAVCSTPSRPTSSNNTGRFGPARTPAATVASVSYIVNSSMHHPQTHSAHRNGASVLTCSYCERPSCPSCTRHCQSCSKRYCTFCSTVNYDESREERVFCLDCHHDAHAEAIGTVAETSHGCMDMEE